MDLLKSLEHTIHKYKMSESSEAVRIAWKGKPVKFGKFSCNNFGKTWATESSLGPKIIQGILGSIIIV